MKLTWAIEPQDAAWVSSFYANWAEDPFVRLRKKRNVERRHPAITKEATWMALVGCLLTTQQRSSPGTPVKRFLDTAPFPLNYRECAGKRDLEAFATRTLLVYGCKRRIPTIPQQIWLNYHMLEGGLWPELLERAEEVSKQDDPSLEREVVHWVCERFKGKGIGPKQSRNLLQWIGATKYEIPVDSRVTNWLNKNLFRGRLGAKLLINHSLADIISDGIQLLCKHAGIYPCLLDAAIFVSRDDGWGKNDLTADSLTNA